MKPSLFTGLSCLALYVVFSPASLDAASMTPIVMTGFNADVVVENTSSGAPYATASELNVDEGRAFYQSGLPGKSYGLPVSGSFTSALDGETLFQFQPYTQNNALVLNANTGASAGSLTLEHPAAFNRIAVIANSANASGTTGIGTVTLTFDDGSTVVTNFNAPDWFGNASYALAGVGRIMLSTGTTDGGPDNPRFYQTTIDLAAALGPNNRPLVSLTFNQVDGARTTAIYAASGELAEQAPAAITTPPASVSVNEFSSATFSAVVAGSPFPTLQWYLNGAPISGATNLSFTVSSVTLADSGDLYKLVAANVVSNISFSVTSSVAALTVVPVNKPIAVTGFNSDLVVESNAAGLPFDSYAKELNPGEGTAFYQSGLPGYSYGLPASGSFLSAVDGSLFQFQPYTASNALVLSSDTSISYGTLTLTAPQAYQSLVLIANSANGDSTGAGNMTLHFTDGSTFNTVYYAPDWFNVNVNVALQGVERIHLDSGHAEGAPNDPRFYQTTLNLSALLGPTNKPLAGITFYKPQANATAIYAVSGIIAPPSPPFFISQPADADVLELNPAVFSAVISGNPYPALQWYVNGSAVAGATNSTYIIQATPLTDNNDMLQLIASSSISNTTYSVTSSIVTLQVTADITPPVLLGAHSLGLNQVEVQFNKPISANTATNAANFSLNGPAGLVSISAVEQDASQKEAVLTVATMTDGAAYGLTVNHLTDQTAHGNLIAANSQADFVASLFIPQTIGNPPLSGSQMVESNGLNVTATGSDIGGTSDQGNFSYQIVSGDFDVAARVADLDLSDVFAKAGWMARETLVADSRYAASLATPGMNGSSFSWRDPAGATADVAGNFPANYPNTWLRLKRTGDTFSGFASYDGQTWTQLGSATMAMSNQLYLGFSVCSHSTNVATTAQFRDVISHVTDAIEGAVVNPHEAIGPSSRATPIVFSEIMYKPADRSDGKNLEFIELYNSNPWFQDISGYQITCADMNFTFPPQTAIPGGGYLVVAAVPADIKSVYGITNVMGPYAGSLKQSETLELLDEQGSVLLTVPYEADYPWPLGADGEGHSIVLARPSYGEGDPRAWDISDRIGGSPGRMDGFTPSPLRDVVINELLPHTENPAVPQFVELYNHSTNTVDLSGCILTDDAGVNKCMIPSGTTIGPAKFTVFTAAQLGFALNGAGGIIYFIKPDGSRILDAVQYGAQSDGVSFGRWPDGANDFYAFTTNTPGAKNSSILIGDVVINELMYDPISGNNDDQYIELYNQGASTVNLNGWQLTGGVTFAFPSILLPSGGYLVVARNQANLLSKYPNLNSGNTVGNYSGKLSHNGELVRLLQPEILNTNTPILVAEDEVTYNVGGRWGEWSHAGGSSLELIDPKANHRLASNWADSDETAKSVWTNIEITGVLDNGANYESSIAHAQLGILDAGECLVDNVEVDDTNGVNCVANPGFESGLAGWSLQGCMTRSSLENTGYGGSGHSLHIRSSDGVWTGDNSCQMELNTNSLAAGQTATLRFKARWLHGWPEVLMRLNGNWLEATGALPVPNNLGSPGAVNSRAVADAGPAIYNVTHTPALPAANQPAVVTANVQTPHGLQSLTLNYRLDPATTYTSVPMKDDGTGGDAIAGDGIYSATIPGQAANKIAAFYISAADNLTAATRFPALRPGDNENPREGVIMFGDSNPGGSFGVYHLWMTQTNLTRWANLGNLSNEGNDCTFVYGNRVFYNIQGRFAGSPFHQIFNTPAGNLCHYNWHFNDDDKFLGSTAFNKIHQPGNSPGDDASLQREQTTWTFMRALGVPWLNRRYVVVYVNGNRRGSLMEDTQVPNGDVVKERFPNDSDGFLYKMQPWFEFAPQLSGYSMGTSAKSYCYLLSYTTTGGEKKLARYRYNYEIRRTLDSNNNYTNVFALVDAAGTYGAPDYVANMESVANMDEWMRVFAANHAAGNIDSFGTAISQNMYGYVGGGGTKYTLLPWDLNIDLGGPQSLAPGQNLLSYDTDDPNMGHIYQTPEFLRMYWSALGELVNGPLNPANSRPLLLAKYDAFVANGLTGVEDPTVNLIPWLAQAQGSIAAQLAAVNVTNFAVNPAVTVSNNLAYVTGQAPVNVATILVNGVAYPVTWTTLTNWVIALPPPIGTNEMNFAGYDREGDPLFGVQPPSFVAYSSEGMVYSQNFDTLPNPGIVSVNSGNPVTLNGITYSLANPFDFAFSASPTGGGGLDLPGLAGWYGHSVLIPQFGATDGDQTTGGVLDFGLPNNPNRALGLLATSSTSGTAFALKLINTGGHTLNYINLHFTGELWRQSDKAKIVQFSYFIDPAANTVWPNNATAFIPNLDVAFPTLSADKGGVAVDGTSPINQTNLSVLNQPIGSWTPGAALWLVWQMPDDSGKAQGLGIDNLNFSATSQPVASLPPVNIQISGGQITLSCSVTPGGVYQIQYKNNLTDPAWMPLGQNQTATGSTLNLNVNVSTNAQRFYRIARMN